MASNIFQITPYSSFRFVNRNPDTDIRYNTLPFDDRQDPLNYFQKWQLNDTGASVQLLSDFVPAFKIYRCSGEYVKDVEFIQGPAIIGVTFLVYNAEVDFSDLSEGAYYGVISYTDENDTTQLYETSPWDVESLHEGTMVYEYTNTFNDKGVVFVNTDKSLLVFAIRVEANFDEFQPLSLDIDYIDQVHDSEVLNNTPYQNEKNYLGLIPDWLVNKMNLVFTLNKVAIDGQYYNRVEGSKFTPTRPDFGVMTAAGILRPTFWVIDIIPNLNFNLEQFKTGDIPTGDLIVIKKAKIFDDIAADFSVSGLFGVNSNLIRIALVNKGLDIFTLNVGITDGGTEIATFDVTGELTQSLDIGHLFNSNTEIFISGIDGTSLKLTLDWNQYDAPTIDPIVSSSGFVKNTLYMYEEVTPGDFALDWNVGTGQGLRNYVGCVLSGTNGTKDRKNKYPIGWDRSLPLTRDTQVGSNSIIIVQSNLPNVQLDVNGLTINTSYRTGGNSQHAAANVPGDPLAKTSTLGGRSPGDPNDPIDSRPDSLYTVYFVKITD